MSTARTITRRRRAAAVTHDAVVITVWETPVDVHYAHCRGCLYSGPLCLTAAEAEHDCANHENTVRVPAAPPVTVLVHDPTGRLATGQGLVFYITECCGASVTGSASGVVCRTCHQRQPDVLAHAWAVGDDAAWTEYRRVWVDYMRPTTHTSEYVIDRIVTAARLAAESGGTL